MRVRSPLVLGLCGLVMSVPAASTASAQDGPYGPEPVGVANSVPAPYAPAMPTAAGTGSPMMGAAGSRAGGRPTAAHHHHGLLSRRHCVECQRAYVKKHDGVDIPPPPGYPGGPPMSGAGTVVSGPVAMGAPGYAVVGGPEGAPGYAVVNGDGTDPTPIGVARGAQMAMADPRMAPAVPRHGAGSYDPAVMQTSVPPPPTPMSGPGHNRPKVISHIFGLPILGQHHQERVEKRRARHSAIVYGDPNQKVAELPASVVYGQK